MTGHTIESIVQKLESFKHKKDQFHLDAQRLINELDNQDEISLYNTHAKVSYMMGHEIDLLNQISEINLELPRDCNPYIKEQCTLCKQSIQDSLNTFNKWVRELDNRLTKNENQEFKKLY